MARIVSTAAVNAIRNEYNVYNPVSLAYEDSILLEASSTNICLYSENFNGIAWSAVNSPVVTPNAIPDSLMGINLDLLADTDVVLRSEFRQTITFTGDGTKSLSVYVKAGTSPAPGGSRIMLFDTTASVARLTATITWNAAGVPTATMATGTLISSTALTNGIYRLSFSAPACVAANAHLCYLSPAVQAAETGNIYVGGYQIENLAFSSSYIKTEAVAVTRSADNYSVPFNLPPQEMTVYCKFIEKGATLITNARIIHIGNSGSVGPRTLIYSPIIGSGYVAYHQNTNGGPSVAVAAGAVPVIGDLVELRMVLTSTGSIFFGQSINNGAEVISGPTAAHSFATAWSSPTLWVGQLGGSLNGNNAFQSVKIARGTLTLAQMRAL